LAAYGYALQIYCDFSGYSDMAIGIALLMGFKLSTNIVTPYSRPLSLSFLEKVAYFTVYMVRVICILESIGFIADFLFPALFFLGLIAYGLIIFSTASVFYHWSCCFSCFYSHDFVFKTQREQCILM
jgi:hypothetical protein